MLYFTYLRTIPFGILFLIVTFYAHSQTYSFNNRSTFYPIVGDTTHYQLDASLLKLNGSSSPSTVYFTRQSGIFGTYSIQGSYISDPSTSNYAKWYLYTNQVNGFNNSTSLYIKIGGMSGSNDKLELYASTNNSSTKLWTSSVGLNALTFDLEIELKNDSIFCSLNNQKDSSEIYLPTYLSGVLDGYMALTCTYTSTKKNLFSCTSLTFQQSIEKDEIQQHKKIASAPKKQEILFNEVLFNPLPYYQEYIELYNNSPHLLSLSNTSLRYEDKLGIKNIPLNTIEIPAYSYLILSKDTSKISQHKPSTLCLSLIQSNFPSLNDDAFTLTLLYGDTILDCVSLSEDLHNPLLTNNEGISLEKTSLSDYSSTSLWTSSAEQGTPWRANSILLSDFQSKESVDCQPIHLFQNKAGHPSYMQITIKNNLLGAYFNVGIYTLEGQEIKSIARALPTKAENSFLWYGDDNQSTPIQTGIYILLIESWDSNGHTTIFKKLISTSN